MLEVASELRSVVVHAVGAVCVRHCEVDLPTGVAAPIRVRVNGFPLTAHGYSLRAHVVSGPAGVRVTDVRPAVDTEVVDDTDLPRVLLDLEAAQERERHLTERHARLADEAAQFGSIQAVMPTQRRGEPPRAAPVGALLELAAFADERLTEVHERLRACADEWREATREVAVCQERVNKLSGAVRTDRARVTASALVTLEGAEDAGSVELALEYHVPGARWAPMYQLRLDDAMTGGTLVLRACVAQRTGEDWTSVRLGLSTADLDRRTDAPELKSLRLGRRQSAPAHPGWREPPTGLSELFAGYDARPALAHTGRPTARPAPKAAGAPYAESGQTRETSLYAAQDAVTVAMPAPVPPMLATPAAPIAPGAASADYEQSPEVAFGGAPPPPPAARARRARVGGRPGGASRGSSFVPEEAEMRYGAPEQSYGPPADPLPPVPDHDLLDYAALELRGADDDAGSRGRLRPGARSADGLTEQYRRRADVVTRLALPEHAFPPRYTAGSYDYRFDTAAPAEVAGDGAWHTIPVCEIEIGLTPEFVCVPALDEAVFGTVVLANSSPHALLAGPADVSVAGEFLLTVPLPTLAPGARERVGVGVVESVQVARQAHMKESTAGLRGGTLVLDHTVEVEAVNHLARSIRLDVLERIPVTDDKDVRIEEHTGKPRWQPDDELRDGRHVEGARVWRVELAAGERVRLTGGYEIRIPAAKAVVGGNRRV